MLDRGYGGAAAGVIAQRDARVGDIIVWRDGAQVDHTAVITAVVLDGNNLDLDLTTLNSKNGNRAFEPNKTLRAINTDDYPGDAWTIYRAR